MAHAPDAEEVWFTTVASPVGDLLVAATREGVVTVSWDDRDRVLERLALRVSPSLTEAPRRLDAVRRQLDEYASGRRRTFELTVDWRLCGPFQRRVLEATAQVPYGATTSYADVAAEAGSPRGARAAGNALGANPVPIVVPCHRVLHAGGGPGGYGGGLERKRILLALEGVTLP